MKSVKKFVHAVVGGLKNPAYRPVEIRILRALAVAVSAKLGIDLEHLLFG